MLWPRNLSAGLEPSETEGFWLLAHLQLKLSGKSEFVLLLNCIALCIGDMAESKIYLKSSLI